MRSPAERNNKFALEELFCRILRCSGFCYLFRKSLWRTWAAILYYHDPKPAVIDAHLEYLARVSRIVALPKLWSSFSKTPLAVITIDDGMVGNLELKEVFQKHRVRPMIYLSTGIICSGCGFWWLMFGSGAHKKIESLKLLDNETRKKVLKALGFEQTRKITPRQAVAVEQLRSMLDWANLGAHTRFHPILTRCEDQECKDEISLSKKELLPFIGVELNHFAYPNGTYSDREIGYVRDAGFESARTCNPGWNGCQSDRYRLKAIYIDDDASVDKFAVQLTGVPAIARHLFAKVFYTPIKESERHDITHSQALFSKLEEVKELSKVQASESNSQPQPIAVLIGQLAAGGGSERQLYMFLAGCDRTCWAPVVYVSGVLGFWEGPIRKLGIPVVLLRGNPLAKMWQFRAACIAQDTKCFFSWSSYTNCYGLALIGGGIRCIGSFRNALFADLPMHFRWLWSWISMASVSTIVCNSSETKTQIAARHGSGKKVVYVPNAVEIFAPEQMRVWRGQWRARLGLRGDALLVLGVGRLAPQKNFARFIDVIAQVNRQLPVRGVIAGKDRGCLADLQGQVARRGLHDTVQFIGHVPDARELVCAADIFLLTSDHEGMPNVVLEAMAAGVPCVTTGVNSIGDLIQDGVTGFVTAHNVDDLAQNVVRLAADAGLRRAVGVRARASIERRYRQEQIACHLWALCE